MAMNTVRNKNKKTILETSILKVKMMIFLKKTVLLIIKKFFKSF